MEGLAEACGEPDRIGETAGPGEAAVAPGEAVTALGEAVVAL